MKVKTCKKCENLPMARGIYEATCIKCKEKYFNQCKTENICHECCEKYNLCYSCGGSNENRMISVFLGGTCSGYNWRNKLIPKLKCCFYNPIVKNWSEEDRLREVYHRENDDYVLYVITSGIKGVYSIAEVVDDANLRPEKTLFCLLEDEKMRKEMLHSLKAVKKLLEDKGINCFDNLDDVANFLNIMQEQS